VKDIITSDTVIELIKQDIDDASHVLKFVSESMLPLFLDQARYDEYFEKLHGRVGDLKRKRILEVGSGYGMMVVHGCLNYGLDMHGLEPPKQGFEGRYEIAQKLLLDNGLDSSRIVCGTGEEIPFPDESFDIVYSFQVLEHVQNPYKVLQESWRVLRPGGILYCDAPNYRTFWEGHYNIPWIPGMPKWAARLYIRLWGRDSSYIDHLNFLNQPEMERWMKQICGFAIKEDFGRKNWVRRMLSPTFSAYANSHLMRFVHIGSKLGIIPLIAAIGWWIKWQDTLIFTVRKPDSDA
jgi:ubiquinone/menaquinone biosynthesis C-methylase UbiE